jgi:hypothetical protein
MGVGLSIKDGVISDPKFLKELKQVLLNLKRNKAIWSYRKKIEGPQIM